MTYSVEDTETFIRELLKQMALNSPLAEEIARRVVTNGL
jgi:hypothetical protein